MSEQKKFVPFVSAETNMTEFTVRALIIGLIMAVVLGAAFTISFIFFMYSVVSFFDSNSS